MCSKADKDKKVQYVFFDTGLEFNATKEHIKELEEKYGVEIQTIKAFKPIPLCVYQYGVPFKSKYVSCMIERLQRHNFQWEDRPFDELLEEYPKCKSALKWWCNQNGIRFNIAKYKYLKEFMVENKPDFKISDKCCTYAKKKTSHIFQKINGIDLVIIGVRKAEGGIRATTYKGCYNKNADGIDEYRPLFWFKQKDKDFYNKEYEITNSRCYTEYGLKRTGCCGCPFGKYEFELEVTKTYEPNLYNAVNNVFGKSYEYDRKYKQFCLEQSRKEDESK